MSPKVLLGSLFEYALIGAGWWLLWKLYCSKEAKTKSQSPRLPHWEISTPTFFAAALFVLGAWFLAQIAAGSLASHFPGLKNDAPLAAIVLGGMAQILLLAGCAAAAAYLKREYTTTSRQNQPAARNVAIALWPAAFVTCIVTISVVYPVQLLWEKLLQLVHLPTDKQEMIEIFFQAASPLRLAGLIVMAVVLAPVGEELVFRAGLFRFLRGRVPRWVALSLPALMFASLHVGANLKGLITVAPLTALGIVFSIAYERTGRIAVPILAHALFNLHTVVFLLLGLEN
ncbi:MAG: CPBP family intramembrane metalloprotease [Nibricoccus sp.]